MNKVRYQNSQLYSECQLVSVLNASYMLGGSFITKGSNEYERLVDFTCGRNGSCIQIEKVYRYLKLEHVDIKPEWDNIKLMVDYGFPVSISVNTPITGNHSVCIVGARHCNGGYVFKVPNINWYTNRMWIHEEELKKIHICRSNLLPHRNYFRMFMRHRLFKLKGEEV